MSADYLVVLVTVADAAAGVALGRTLVEEELAACAQVMPGGTAIYRWQGEMHADPQTQLLIKTRRGVWPALQSRILALHDDEVPEILALPVADGLPAYLGWLDEMTTAEVPVEEEAAAVPATGDLAGLCRCLPARPSYYRRHASGSCAGFTAHSSTTAGTSWSICRHRTPRADITTRCCICMTGRTCSTPPPASRANGTSTRRWRGWPSQGIEAIVVGIPNIGPRRYP